MTCPHSIPLEDSCGICDAEKIMVLKARIEKAVSILKPCHNMCDHVQQALKALEDK